MILTRSNLELLRIIFPTFKPELLPLIYAKISFSLNILNKFDRISPNFIYAFILTRSSLRLLHVIFSYICIRVIALDLRQNFILRTNIQNFTKFYICIHVDMSSIWLIHIPFPRLYQSHGPWCTPKFLYRSIQHIFTKLYICIDINKVSSQLVSKSTRTHY